MEGPLAASLIPERTIDQWVSIVVAGVDPTARIWAPTPRAQAGAEPWDHAIDGSGRESKLIVLESKALLDYSAVAARNPHVSIKLDQLLRLVHLELVEGLPAFYALPALTVADLGGGAARSPMWWASVRNSPSLAGDWIRVPSATELALNPEVLTAITLGHQWKTISTADIAAGSWPSLLRRLVAVRQCEAGRLLSPATPFGPLAPGLLTETALRLGAETARTMLIESGGDHRALLAQTHEQSRVEPVQRDDRDSRLLERTLWVELSRA